MTAKKAQISTMILLVVPLGFSTGTELLKTMAHKSHTDFPIVKVDPPASVQSYRGEKDREINKCNEQQQYFSSRQRFSQYMVQQCVHWHLTTDEPTDLN